MPRGVNPSDEARHQGRLWTPTALRGDNKLFGWYDAKDLATIVITSGAVSDWKDKSGRNHHLTQATSANRPTFSHDGLGAGHPALLMSAAGASVPQCLTTLAFAGLSTMVTAYAVGFMNSATASFGRLVSISTYFENDHFSASAAIPIIRSGSNEQLAPFTSSATGNAVPITYGRPFIVGSFIAELGKAANVNGGATTASVAHAARTFSDPAFLGIGNEWSGENIIAATEFDGGVSELLICANETASDRQKIEGYLAWKWGRTGDFSASHPYKNRPPLVGA